MSMSSVLGLSSSSLSEDLNNLEVLRYLAISALSVLMWDTILLFRDEYHIVWRRAPIMLRIGYAINKYGSIIALISMLVGITPLGKIGTSGCLILFYIDIILSSVSETIGNALTVFKVVMSWNKNQKVLVQLLTGCTVVFAVNLICIILSLRKASESVVWIYPPVGSCALLGGLGRPYVIVMRVVQVLFDVFAVCLAILNGLHIPRRLDESFMKILYEEKLALLLAAFLMRIFYLVLIVSSMNPVRLMIGPVYITAFISIANSRLVLELGRQYSAQVPMIHLQTISGKR